MTRHWYEQAATQGHAGAQNNLVGLYEFGHGVKQDSVRAFMWYNVAASLSTNDPQKDVAAENRDEIAGGMTSAQISEAKRLTSQCQTRQFKDCRAGYRSFFNAPPRLTVCRPAGTSSKCP